MIRLVLCLLLVFTSACYGYPQFESNVSHRSVILFAPSHDKVVRQFLLEALINECELKNRQVFTMVITAEGKSDPVWLKDHFNLKAMYQVFNVNKESHTTILIGKDGDEKLRWGSQTDWHKVNDTIDQMPLRQWEARNGGTPCSA